jgi:predicted Rossmann fold nucleotide-binding protein DprA/Smf involved in DNA uptake
VQIRQLLRLCPEGLKTITLSGNQNSVKHQLIEANILRSVSISIPNLFQGTSNFDRLYAIGESQLFEIPSLGFFCSVRCPASIILKTHEFAQKIKVEETAVISGFHSSVEKEVLTTLLQGTAPIIVCSARSIENMRISAKWRPAINDGRMLIISPFPKNQRRATKETVSIRNQLVGMLAETIFIAYAEDGGKTKLFAGEMLKQNKEILTIQSKYTQNLITMGAKTSN